MATNDNLTRARKEKNDEFYTRFNDIEKEVGHYREQFKDKTVFCNCNDSEHSKFWTYFKLNFEHLGLKRLIATHFKKKKPSYKLEYDGKKVIKTDLKENGDFRSPESIEILKESDIVVTNPPSSLLREHIAQLMEYNKKFLIVGNKSAITCKEIFILLKNEKIWLGYNRSGFKFKVPDSYDKGKIETDDNGNVYANFGHITWYTNLELTKRQNNLILYKTYNEVDYPKYANFDGINVNKVKDIPCNYDGVMGVPISFMDKYDPEQFEIVGMSGKQETMDQPVTLGKKFIEAYREQGGTGHFSQNMYGLGYFDSDGEAKVPYGRILIRKKNNVI